MALAVIDDQTIIYFRLKYTQYLSIALQGPRVGVRYPLFFFNAVKLDSD